MNPPPTHHAHLDDTDPAHEGYGLLADSVVDAGELAAHRGLLRRGRRRERLLAIGIAFVALAGSAVLITQVAFTNPGSTTGTAPTVAVQGEAVGAVVLRPGVAADRVAQARPVRGVRSHEATTAASYAVGTEGRVAQVSRMQSSSTIAVARRRSTSSAKVEHVSLFGGRVEISGADITAAASSVDGRASGAITLAPSTVVTVAGKPVVASPNQRVAIEGVGTLILNEQAVVAGAPRGDAQTGPRYRVVGAIAHVRITTAYEGLPVGSELIIGRVDAGVREGKVVEIQHPDPNVAPAAPNGSPASPAAPAAPVSGNGGLGQVGTPKPGESTLPRRATSVRANAGGIGVAQSSLQSYVFPVLGQTSYTDTWGAARASTGIPHQGTDIFADEGTPIVAVADGTLNRVGWNAIGGYRFWLVDRFGNSFYHAHLSAYAPLAVDGASVKAGDVIGFVGHTGDAQGTPNHLHFEVHPGGGAPTDPFTFLNAWKHGIAVAIGLGGTTGGEPKVGPLALLGFTDISSNSGLQGSVLDTVPDTSARPIEYENQPVATDDSLRGAIDGPGISAGH